MSDLLKNLYLKVSIGNAFSFQSGDGFLENVSFSLSEQERSSNCAIAINDPGLKVCDALLTEFQRVGGVLVPVGFLEEPQAAKSESAGATAGGSAELTGQGAQAYLKDLESRFGKSDLSGLTSLGKRALRALENQNVRAFLDAIAIAEVGESAAKSRDGGYGYIFGKGQTYDPSKLNDHPRVRITAGGFTSSATGRYQTMDFVWDDDTPYGRRGMGLKDFKPISQEILAVGRLIFRGILDEVEAGKADAAVRGSGSRGSGARYEWASLYGNPYGQGTTGGQKATFLANFAKGKGSSNTVQPKTTELTVASEPTPEKQASDDQKKADVPGKVAGTEIDLTNGITIAIEVGLAEGKGSKDAIVTEFLLTDVRGTDGRPQQTVIQGRQLRALIARTKKSYQIIQGASIRTIAIAISKKTGVTIDLPDTPSVSKVQSIRKKNESDYEALVKLAKKEGLFVRGDAKKIKLEQLKDREKAFEITRSMLLPGSTFGDSATSDRLVEGQKTATNPDTEKKEGVTESSEKASELNEEKGKDGKKDGKIDVKQVPDEAKGIGRGFVGQLAINTLANYKILELQPGEIVKLSETTGLGDAIARDYRVDRVSHSFQGSPVTTIDYYLPVAIAIPTKEEPKASPGSKILPGTHVGATKLPANLQAPLKRGETIAGYVVTSPYGRRSAPVRGASSYHRGVDVGTPNNTPLYPILKPGEKVQVTIVDYSPNLAGITAIYESQGYKWRYLHLHPSTPKGTRVVSYGEVFCRSGDAGTGPHLHFEQWKAGGKTSSTAAIPPQAGFVYWAITGKPPKGI